VETGVTLIFPILYNYCDPVKRILTINYNRLGIRAEGNSEGEFELDEAAGKVVPPCSVHRRRLPGKSVTLLI